MNAAVRRFWHLVQLQLAEVLHQRIVWILAGAAAAVVIAAAVLRDLNFGRGEAHFFLSAARVALGFTGTVLVALLGPTLLAPRFAPVLFARGVRRSEWVLANFAATVVAVGWLVVVLGVALAASLAWHGHGDAVDGALRALARGAGGLIMLAGAAVFFASVFERLIPGAAATFALALAAHLSPVIDHLRAHSGAAAGAVWRVLDWLVPNFEFAARASAGDAAVYVVSFAALYALAAIVVFLRREL